MSDEKDILDTMREATAKACQERLGRPRTLFDAICEQVEDDQRRERKRRQDELSIREHLEKTRR